MMEIDETTQDPSGGMSSVNASQENLNAASSRIDDIFIRLQAALKDHEDHSLRRIERIKNICDKVEEKINEMYEDMGDRLEMLSPEGPTLNSLAVNDETPGGGLVEMA